MPTTYDLLSAAALFLATSGELEPEEFTARLDAFLAESGDKLAALRAIAKAAAATEAMHREESAGHDARANRAAATEDRMRDLAYQLLAARRELGEDPKVAGVARIQRNGGKAPLLGLDTLDADTLPGDLVVVTRRPDVAAIRAVLDAGGTVPGVTLGERGEGVRWE